MRIPRLKPADRTVVYHCLSRTVGGQPLLGPAEREQFRRCLWRQAQFCGIQLITYAVLNNHFHLLARVPHRQPPTDRELLQRVSGFYGPKAPLTLRLKSQLHHQGRLADKERAPLLRRMGDISVFMKELKQGFSRWYNQRHQRYGTLWAERFKSLLVEDQPGVVGTVAAYIDLNAVRAGLVSDPKDYRFCGYAEAVAGGALAREGLMSLGRPGGWAEVAAAYRQELFVRAGAVGQAGKRVLDSERILKVLAQGGQISRGEALRLRLRYLSDGLALGSGEYVEGLFQEYRRWFSRGRRSGGRPLRRLPFGELRTLRDLRVRRYG